MTPAPDLLPFIKGLAFPESPRRHDGALWFSDFYERRVSRVTPDGQVEPVVDVPGQPSGLGWLPDGRLLVVSMNDRRLLRLEGRSLVEVADLSSLAPAEDMHFPNGTVLTPDGRTLIVAESYGQRLTAFDVAADGTLANRRVWAQLHGKGVGPDGICLDAQGAVWLASPVSREVLRVREGGEVTHRIPTQAQAVACMLGGQERRTLFVLTGRVLVTPGQSLAERSGMIMTVRVDVPGAGLP